WRIAFPSATSFRSPLRSALHGRGWVQAHVCTPSATTASADFSLRSRYPYPASPFQARGEISPGKNDGLPRTTAGSTPLCFGRESFAVIGPLALLGSASYPVSVRRLDGFATPLLPALSSRAAPCG